MEKANKVFDLFRANEHGLVDEESFVNHWTGLQQRVSALDFFAAMVTDGSGLLSRKSFLDFWRSVREQGTSDDEIAV